MLDLVLKVWDRITMPRHYPDEWQLAPPLTINEDGWLEGPGVFHMKSHPSWHYRSLLTPGSAPQAIVSHVSATPIGTAAGMAKRRMRERTKEDRAASWHCSVEPEQIVQMISFESGAWHAKGRIAGVGPANRVSASIELIGYERGPFQDNQVLNYARVTRALVQSYGIKRALALVPHAVIDPDDRSDPGREFMTKHAAHVLAFAFA